MTAIYESLGPLQGANGVYRTKTKTIYDASSIPTLDLPTVTAGDPLPYLFGTRKISSPKVAYYGNLQPHYAYSTVQNTYNATVGMLNNDVSFMNQAFDAAEGGGDGGSVEVQSLALSSAVSAGQANKNPYIPDYFSGLVGAGHTIAPSMTQKVYDVYTETTVTLDDYSFDVMIAVAVGPGVSLTQIWSGDDLIWYGDTGADRFELANDPTLYPMLGEGFIWHGGAFDQSVEAYLRDNADDPTVISAFPGIAYFVVKQVASKDFKGAALAFVCKRLANPLALTTTALSPNGFDVNFASAAVDVLTNDWGALGIDVADIDMQTFTAVAATFVAEGLYGSDIIASDSGGVDALQAIQTATDSLIFCDPSTGLVTIRLLRDNITTTNPPILVVSPANTSQLQDYKKDDWKAVPTVLEVDYVDRGNNYDDNFVKVANPAQPPGKTRRTSLGKIDATAVCDDSVALNVLDLYLSRKSAPVLTMTAIVNRDAINAMPGSIVMVDWPQYGLSAVPFWVMKWREFDNDQIALELEQYQFLGVTRYYSLPEPSQHVPANVKALAPGACRFIVAPYYVALASNLISDYQTPTFYYFPMVLLEAANDFQSYFNAYNMVTGIMTQSGMNYTPRGFLSAAIAADAGSERNKIKSLTFTSASKLGTLPKVQSTEQIKGVVGKPTLLFINDEIMSYGRLEKNGDGSWTAYDVYRSLCDTLQGAHAAGDDVWLYDVEDKSRLIPGLPLGLPQAITYGFAAVGLGGDTLAPIAYGGPLPDDRANRMLRVVQPLINHGTGREIELGEDFTVSWKLRTKASRYLSVGDEKSDFKEQQLTDGLYRWQPVVFATLLQGTNGTLYASSRQAWEDTYTANEAISQATEITGGGDVTGNPTYGFVVGPATLLLLTFIYDYDINAQKIVEWQSEVQTLDIYIRDPAAFDASFTFDYKTGFATDFTFDFAKSVTIPTIINP